MNPNLTPSQIRALSKAPYLHEMDEPDQTSLKELYAMRKMGLPTCFFNSPHDLDSDEEVCTVYCINRKWQALH